MTEQRGPGQGVVLWVASSPRDWATTTAALRDAGYDVVETRFFNEARSLLSSLQPKLLMTELMLGSYNGLHLAWLRRGHHPTGPSVVIHERPDPVLEKEAARIGCLYLLKPIDPQIFLNVVTDLLDPGHQQKMVDKRQSPRTKIGGRMTLKIARTHASVIDVSYGGCRLQFLRRADATQPLSLSVPASDLIVEGTRVWSDSTRRKEVYGVAIHGSKGALQAWRDFVDRATLLT